MTRHVAFWAQKAKEGIPLSSVRSPTPKGFTASGCTRSKTTEEMRRPLEEGPARDILVYAVVPMATRSGRPRGQAPGPPVNARP